jgi:hypothetical protein
MSQETVPGVIEPEIVAADREHWAFQPIARPSVPTVVDADWAQNPIDAFVLLALQQQALKPMPRAKSYVLQRRLSLDVLGTVGAYTKVAHENHRHTVEQMLASPLYGQRQAQLWLDLARFAETDGFEHDLVRKNAWKYRDWVVNAFNRNLPYDDFVTQQLAGDELPLGRVDATATMFCLSGPDMPDINSQDLRKHALLNEITATVGAVFLGLQIGCAQCHDHKYDPVSQADFYRLRALFQPSIQVKRNKSIDVMVAPNVAAEGHQAELSYIMERGEHDQQGAQIEPGFLRIIGKFASSEIQQTATNTSGRRLALSRWLMDTDNPLTARVMINRIWQQHFGRGLVDTPSDFGLLGSAPTHPQLLDWLAAELISNQWDLKAIHRLILTSATYCQASVPQNASREVSASDWDYRQQKDPQNQYLARFPMQRLSGESLRNAMLTVAGVANNKMGGAGVRPPIQAELKATLLKGHWEQSPQEADHYRRSIYLFARRNFRYPFFATFDRPAANNSCPVRNKSTTPLQALMLLNSQLTLDLSRRMAGDILRNTDSDDGFIREAIRRGFGREPDKLLIQKAQNFLQSQRNRIIEDVRVGREYATPLPNPEGMNQAEASVYTDLCLVIFNALEFMYIQ